MPYPVDRMIVRSSAGPRMWAVAFLMAVLVATQPFSPLPAALAAAPETDSSEESCEEIAVAATPASQRRRGKTAFCHLLPIPATALSDSVLLLSQKPPSSAPSSPALSRHVPLRC